MKTTNLQGKVLNSASFIAQFAISMINLALVYYLRLNFNLSAQLIGLSAAIYTGTYFLFCIVLEPITHRMRPRHSVELSMVGMAFVMVALLITKNIIFVFILLFFYGLFMSFLWPQVQTWLARGKEGDELSRATSSFNSSWSLGAALSPLLTGTLVAFNTSYPIVVGIVLLFSVYFLIAISTKLVPSIRSIASEKENIEKGDLVDQSTPLRFLSWAGVLVIYAALAILITIFPLYALDELTINERSVGLLLLIRGMATFIMFIVLGKTSWWHFNKTLILSILVLYSLLYFWGTMIESFLLYMIFFFISGILFAFAYSFSIFHGASGSVNRSKRMLVHEVLLTIGTIIGSILGGYFYEKFGYDAVLKGSSVVVLLPLFFTIIKKRG